MGRSYWFECSRCGYRAMAAGNSDRGPDFFVQTIVCLDCKKIYDAVTKLRLPSPPMPPPSLKPLRQLPFSPAAPEAPPTFHAALSRLPFTGIKKFRWKIYDPACPVNKSHRVEKWFDPGPCPRCGLLMEKNPLPYRIWE